MFQNIKEFDFDEFQDLVNRADTGEVVRVFGENIILINVNVKKYSPCDIKPLKEGKKFFYDPNNLLKDCLDHVTAEQYMRRYVDHNYSGELSAEDFNNVACAYVWQTLPDWEKAEELLKKAKEKAPENEIICANYEKVDDNCYSPVIPIHRAYTTVKGTVLAEMPEGVVVRDVDMITEEMIEQFHLD